MKGNDGTGNTIDRDDWRTPKQLWNALNKQYNFQFDCCCSMENAKCLNGTSDFLNYNTIPLKNAWMNPPFSKAFEMFEHFIELEAQGVCIYRCDNMETKVWQMILEHCSWIHIFPSRVNYEGHEGKGARFPSALIGFNVDPPEKKRISGITLFIKTP